MDNLINELYYGNIRPVEQMGGITPKAASAMMQGHENGNRLEVSLNEQESELLHTLQNDRLEVTCIIEEKRFRETFILGAWLMMEIMRCV